MRAKTSEPPGTGAPLCFVFGEDDFAVKQRARQIYHAWCQETGGFDNETIDATASNSGEALRAIARLREALQTIPFFGGGKAVWFQNCNFLGDERAASTIAVTEALAELARELKEFKWGGVRLLITSGKVDKRKTFYKTLEKLGQVETFAGWSLEDKDWADQAEMSARKQLRSLGKEIGGDALAALVANVGPNNRLLTSEVEKLALFLGDRTQVTVEDIESIVSRQKQAKAFALADALGARHLPRLLKTLDQEVWSMQTDSSRSEVGLLYGFISKVRTMLFLREMIREGWIRPNADFNQFKTALESIPPDALPKDRKYNPLAMHPYMLFNALTQARNYTTDELVSALDLLLQCNLRMTSTAADPVHALQETLIRIVGTPRRAAA